VSTAARIVRVEVADGRLERSAVKISTTSGRREI
jgi:hypothetical protein